MQGLERLARHSLFGRYMKAQPRLAGDRSKTRQTRIQFEKVSS